MKKKRNRKTETHKVHVLVSGRVQGVGYRYFIRGKARKYNVSGWVKNNDTGTVEALFQGTAESLNLLLEQIKEGPFLAEVKDIELKWHSPKSLFESFTILR